MDRTGCSGQEKRWFHTLLRGLSQTERRDQEGRLPLPGIDETLDALAGAKVFTTPDLASGYWQVKVDIADHEKTAFTTCHGLFKF